MYSLSNVIISIPSRGLLDVFPKTIRDIQAISLLGLFTKADIHNLLGIFRCEAIAQYFPLREMLADGRMRIRLRYLLRLFLDPQRILNVL
jgi:hypothetical protein